MKLATGNKRRANKHGRLKRARITGKHIRSYGKKPEWYEVTFYQTKYPMLKVGELFDVDEFRGVAERIVRETHEASARLAQQFFIGEPEPEKTDELLTYALLMKMCEKESAPGLLLSKSTIQYLINGIDQANERGEDDELIKSVEQWLEDNEAER